MRFPVVLAGCLIAVAMLAGCGGSSGSGDAVDPIGSPSNPVRAVSFQRDPFRLCFNGTVCTAAAGPDPQPTHYDYIEGARPRIDLSTADAFPAFGWVVGTTTNRVFNHFIWQGNRLSGHDYGTLYQVTSIASVDRQAHRTVLKLNTNYAADPRPATLTIRATESGAVRFHLTPPPGMRKAGIAVTMFTIARRRARACSGWARGRTFSTSVAKSATCGLSSRILASADWQIWI